MDEISEPATAKEEGRGGGEAEAKAEEKAMMVSRKEKRKAMKKMKRKQTRKEIAAKQREEQEAMLNDPQELVKMRIMEQEEAERSEIERKMFEERERAWIEALEIKKKEKQIEEEEERRTKEEEQLSRKQQVENEHDRNEVDDWEYVEEGPAEIIWQGNEITVKKKRVKVPKRNTEQKSRKEDSDRPTSNPLPPQSEAFTSSMSAQQLIENVAQQVPHFGTEQDKAHCPFHLKTGACRFGQRCSRVHFYPDKSSTLLIKNMYNGPGLAWEQDEVLEGFGLGCIGIIDIANSCTDEEVDRCYEEFYEDVHTEFLKFGEIINFKVCRNGSFHLRGNVYIHYKSLDSAVHAYQSINGRYFAGKQISCEFINVTRWKVAICGEYMKSRYKSCSHGTSCNFIHCFRNPGGDYEWADSDRPPPKYWVKKMVALFGYSDACEKQMVEETFGYLRNSSKMSMTDSERYRLRRSRSRERDSSSSIGSGKRYDNENYVLKGTCRQRHTGDDKHQGTILDEDPCMNLKHYHHRKRSKFDTESDGELLDRDGDMDRDKHHGHTRKSSRRQNTSHKNETYETGSDGDLWDREQNIVTQHDYTRKSSSQQWKVGFLDDDGDYENKNHEVDRDLSDREKDRDAYHDNRISSGLKRKVGYPDNHKDNKIRVRDTDGEWSDSNRRGDKYQRRKTLGLSSKASKFIDHGNRTRSCSTEFGDDYLDKDAERHRSHARKRSKHWDEVSDISDDNPVPAQNLKHRGDDLSIEVRKVESPVKKLRSDGTHEASSLGQYKERDRSHDSDLRCIYDVHIDEQDRWEPDNGSSEIYHNCKRETGSLESNESGRPGRYNGGDESSDFDYYDKIGREDRYEPEKPCSKHWKSGRKSTNNDWELENENRSLGSIQSSRTRRSCSLEEETDSSEDNKESGRKHKKHRVGHRSGDHKRHHKKN